MRICVPWDFGVSVLNFDWFLTLLNIHIQPTPGRTFKIPKSLQIQHFWMKCFMKKQKKNDKTKGKDVFIFKPQKLYTKF